MRFYHLDKVQLVLEFQLLPEFGFPPETPILQGEVHGKYYRGANGG
jgi:hypothetical protein